MGLGAGSEVALQQLRPFVVVVGRAFVGIAASVERLVLRGPEELFLVGWT